VADKGFATGFATGFDDLQFAFFNGDGWESWENVWGIWNGLTPRDGEATRRMATMEHAVAPFFASTSWEPFSPMHMSSDRPTASQVFEFDDPP
jgi:hypothetical protein